MEMQVDAVYENGVLKPLQPLGLAEHEHVSVTVIKAAPAPGSPQLDIAYLESLQTELLHAGPAPGIEEVRRRLSRIPGSMTGDFIAEREER
jgi:predicted DNA-binding antitoxin AbrB/MazE fold protein